ncbi:MarR family transcriptional regulator [Paenibacillus sp. SC116]|uniref:MarR family winged helix-turn-helix transcriptional regulator n=1 Tax=Paenibacillus sp. SC116 TaxID=2968986 RepID=UPI00215AE1C8|nr:MarR family transcriptional regulator [Paenibacillus sp. SC116]MCR8844256.1 MarR family transcriptional regulator [Paenibacillus sp. SC116]
MIPYSSTPESIDIIHVLIRTTYHIQREFDAQLSTLDVPFQISGPRLRLLSTVSQSGSIRMNELAAKIGVKARSVTDIVDALEKDKLLVRIPDPMDRRATLIQLTKLAETHLSQVLALQDEISDRLLGNLSLEQRKQFLDLLFQLNENKDLSQPCEGFK